MNLAAHSTPAPDTVALIEGLAKKLLQDRRGRPAEDPAMHLRWCWFG